MLTRLTIQNLALIESCDVSFGSGFTVVTGESGAGKSLLLRALALTLGAKADREDVGSFGDKATIESEFDVTFTDDTRNVLTDAGLELADGNIILRRELSANGRSRVFFNDQLTNLDVVTSLADKLCILHSQAASVSLRDDLSQLETLDSFAGVTADVRTLGERFDELERTQRQITALERDREKIAQERELLEFQINEIQKANLSLDEEDKLIEEKKRLDSAERILQNCDTIIEALEGENGVTSILQAIKRPLADVAGIDKTFTEHKTLFDSTAIQFEELRRGIDEYRSEIFVDDERLNAINERLAEIYRLKSKYGGTVKSALERLTKNQERLEVISDPRAELSRLEKLHNELKSAYTDLALKIRNARFSSAKSLTSQTQKQLTDLAIPQNQFEFRFQWEVSEPNSRESIKVTDNGSALSLKPERHGLESGRFFFSANPGEEPKPLSRVASGGEMSRALLALDVAACGTNETSKKSAKKSKNKNSVMTRVFDEIDTGVSGKTATAMGKKLKELSSESQVVVITHLRQVVLCANSHLLVEKTEKSGKNRVGVRALNAKESEKAALSLVDMA